MLGQQQQGAALLQLKPASSSSMLATQAEQSSFSSFKSLLSMIDTHGNLKCPPEPKTLSLSSPTSIVKSFMSLTPTKHKAISDWFSTGNKSSTLGEPELPLSTIKRMKLKTTTEVWKGNQVWFPPHLIFIRNSWCWLITSSMFWSTFLRQRTGSTFGLTATPFPRRSWVNVHTRKVST